MAGAASAGLSDNRICAGAGALRALNSRKNQRYVFTMVEWIVSIGWTRLARAAFKLHECIVGYAVGLWKAANLDLRFKPHKMFEPAPERCRFPLAGSAQALQFVQHALGRATERCEATTIAYHVLSSGRPSVLTQR